MAMDYKKWEHFIVPVTTLTSEGVIRWERKPDGTGYIAQLPLEVGLDDQAYYFIASGETANLQINPKQQATSKIRQLYQAVEKRVSKS